VVVVEFPVNKLQSFGGIFKCVFQLQDHSMLWCPGLTFGRLERARQHMVQVMKFLAYLCPVEVQVTCRSDHTFLVDSFLVDESSAAATDAPVSYWPV
jgi:hypothetical protein